MAAIIDEQLREEVERIVIACLPDPLGCPSAVANHRMRWRS